MDITRETYRRVLGELEAGPKSGEEIASLVRFPSVEHCSAALAKLVRHGYIKKAYRLTDEGKRALHSGDKSTTGALLDDSRVGVTTESVVRLIPPMPNPKMASPGFEWVFHEQEWKWVQRRKQELRSQVTAQELFG